MTQSPDRNSALAKRFYKAASCLEGADGYRIQLDGRTVKTPARADLIVRSRRVADALVQEWESQTTHIRPETMPLTRLVNVAIDAAPAAREALVAELSRYAETDLTCHLAEAPLALAEREAAVWAPLRDWAGTTLGVHLTPVAGIHPAPQPAASLEAVRAYGARLEDLRLTALVHATTLLGSVVLALALAEGRLDAESAFAASRVDEDWQAERWGQDEEAVQAAAARAADLRAISPVFAPDTV
jgi:chaperone required for assembly of F1-ATPase